MEKRIKQRTHLYLDDFRIPQHSYNYTYDLIYLQKDWVIVRDYSEFVRFLTIAAHKEETWPEVISFDHDLHDEHYTPQEHWDDYEKSKAWQDAQVYTEKTGLECAKWLVELCMDKGLKLPKYLCHSQNPVGKDNILGYLDNYKKHNEQL